ncbi:hypothetical protein C0995_005435 [Termitomyces sp. Mi166|nr:hypothetical protein C0995_005435 [Termitomyces sp. Mi166\
MLRSIKRRSAFIQHLKKHGIDPESINIDALAPALLPRLAPYQRKSAKSAQAQPSDSSIAPEVIGLPPNIVLRDGAFYHQDNGPNGSVLHPVPELTGVQGPAYTVDGSWHQEPIKLPVLPEAGLYTIDIPTSYPILPTEGLLTFDSPSPHNTGAYIDSPVSNPGLSYSVSPSPSPPQQNLLPPAQDMRGYASTSRPSTPASMPSKFQPSSLMFFPDPTSYAAHSTGQKPVTEWDFEASIFAPSHGEFQGIRV